MPDSKTTNSSRLFLHIDFNAYFASAEQQANPLLRGKAIGIGGKPGTRSIIATASYEARAKGVQTGMSSEEALEHCPDLELIHGDPRKYSELTDRLHAILLRWAPELSCTSIDEAYADITDAAGDWLGALTIALRIREAVRQEIGPYVTVSIGVAPNLLLAKMASSSEKPNGLFLLYPQDVSAFMQSKALCDIPGIGPRLERRLNDCGIYTVAELQARDHAFLCTAFRGYGTFLYQACRGIGATRLTPREHLKSVGHSYTLPANTQQPRPLYALLSKLADKTAWRLRHHRLVARRYTAIARFADKRFQSRQGTLPAPTHHGLTLAQHVWPHLLAWSQERPIRLVGLVAHDLVPTHIQRCLDPKAQKEEALLPALDQLQQRYGPRAWLRAVQLYAPTKERSSGFHFDHKP